MTHGGTKSKCNKIVNKIKQLLKNNEKMNISETIDTFSENETWQYNNN